MRKFIDSVSRFLTESEDPCWDGYEQYGMKKKGKKEVPNCVPVEEDADEEQAPKVNKRTSDEVRFTEADLRAAHKDGYYYAKKQSPNYKGPYMAYFWDHSALRKKLGLGPKK